jgi:radical SAM protein with 4Fe4S-binding SPASM domain
MHVRSVMGVGPSGDIAPCHRFVDSDERALGHISTGVDREKQKTFLNKGHVNAKYECHECFARPLCAGTRPLSAKAHRPSELALLRLDSGMDRHLSADLWRDQRAGSMRRST